MKLTNTTLLSTDRLTTLFAEQVDGWPHRALTVRVRYSRGREFSGTCDYTSKAIYINLGRQVQYPYDIYTHIARAKSNATHWWKPIYRVRVADAYGLALYVFCHELYHWLVKQARRNTRQKESMCDRFATRVLVDQYGAGVFDESGCPVARTDWDFQDFEAFVARARRLTQAELAATRKAQAACRPRPQDRFPADHSGQPLLFPL